MEFISSEGFVLYTPKLVVNLQGRVRRATYNGRKYLVAPVSLIVPGVLHGSKGALLYPPNEIKKSVAAWNRMPLTVYHPMDSKGNPASAKDSGVYNRQGIGFIVKPTYNGKLAAEAWFDIKRTQAVDNRVYTALVSGNKIELSTGLFTDNQPAPVGSNHNGRPYAYIARNYKPDHVAILPDQTGACSLRDGCGVLVNKAHTQNTWSDAAREASARARQLAKHANEVNTVEAHKAASMAHDKAAKHYQSGSGEHWEHTTGSNRHHNKALSLKHKASEPTGNKHMPNKRSMWNQIGIALGFITNDDRDFTHVDPNRSDGRGLGGPREDEEDPEERAIHGKDDTRGFQTDTDPTWHPENPLANAGQGEQSGPAKVKGKGKKQLDPKESMEEGVDDDDDEDNTFNEDMEDDEEVENCEPGCTCPKCKQNRTVAGNCGPKCNCGSCKNKRTMNESADVGGDNYEGWTPDKHEKQASFHEMTAQEHGKGGRYGLALHHDKQSKLHRRFAKSKMSGIPAGNKSTKTVNTKGDKMTRNECIAGLVENAGDIWDEDTLNGMSDEQLIALNAKFVSGAVSSDGMNDDDDTEDDNRATPGATGQDGYQSIKKKRKGATKNKSQKMEDTTQNVDEWFRTAPPQVQEAVQNAMDITNEARNQLIEKMTAHVTNKDEKDELIEQLGTMSLNQLKLFSKAIPAPRQQTVQPNNPFTRPALFQGAAAPVGNSNGSSKPKIEPLISPTINYADLVEEQRRSHKGRQTA